MKTGKDAQAASINLSSSTPTTIAFLTDLKRFPPSHSWPPPNRIAPKETTLWTLDALDSFKFEDDPQTETPTTTSSSRTTLGGYGKKHTDTLSQTVNLLAGGSIAPETSSRHSTPSPTSTPRTITSVCIST